MMAFVSALFTPFSIGPVEVVNRIAVSPMCQYSADDGVAGDWHFQHLVQLGYSGAGLVMVEATAVERRGRITHGCLGLYSDSAEDALAGVIRAARRFGGETKFGVQLAHAGRKASAQRPWEGGSPLGPGEEPWNAVGPSAIPFAPGWPPPEELDGPGITAIVSAFVAAAQRAARIGFDLVELHGAHGYLLHSFYSPIANHRADGYGGNRANRMRLALEVARAVRESLPERMALGMRITGSDWAEGGLTPDDAVALAGDLKAAGVQYVCVSSGGIVSGVKIPAGPGYQVPFAAKVKRETGIATRAVGMIRTPDQAEEIIASGSADLVALARAFLDDPRWGWHAADRLGGKAVCPRPYERSRPPLWTRPA